MMSVCEKQRCAGCLPWLVPQATECHTSNSSVLRLVRWPFPLLNSYSQVTLTGFQHFLLLHHSTFFDIQLRHYNRRKHSKLQLVFLKQLRIATTWCSSSGFFVSSKQKSFENKWITYYCLHKRFTFNS